ncbi:MAG: SCP2 sterol-binding domain-containing protein [Pseudomonadota bacterium]|nr:SCP2 sterol-binding domain-containing protein [Pseudomonadota bacterium]
MVLENLTSLVNSSLKYSNIKDDILIKNNNKVICIKLKNTKTTIFIVIRDGTLIFQDSHIEEPDLLIEGSPINLLSYIKNYDKSTDIKIHGDILLAEDITLLSKNINIDWELLLSEHSSDAIAHYSF